MCLEGTHYGNLQPETLFKCQYMQLEVLDILYALEMLQKVDS